MILCVCPNPSVDIYVWIDAVHAGRVNRASREEHFPGGKGVHVALACAEMGEEVKLLGFWGGPTGEWIRKECLAYGIQSAGVELSEWSRCCQSFKSDNEFDETELLGVGPAVTGQQQSEFDRLFRESLPGARCVSMSGSWPGGSSPDAYAGLIKSCREAGVEVFLDCSGEQFENALPLKPFAIHLNTNEARNFFGGNQPEQLASELVRHCSLAAITEGRGGLYLTDGKEMVHAQVDLERCFSAVGSGDCLVAGLILATLRKMDLADSARLGVACGAANCLRQELGMLNRSDVDGLYPKVQLRRIN